MTTALLTVRRIRAAKLFVGRQRAGAAIGEGRDRRWSPGEQEIEQRRRVGDIDVAVPVRVERGHATGLGRSREEPVESASCVGNVDLAVVVAVAAQNRRS